MALFDRLGRETLGPMAHCVVGPDFLHQARPPDSFSFGSFLAVNLIIILCK